MSEASEKEELRKALDAVREEMRTKQLSEEGNATEIELLREELESTRIETETLRTECEQIRVANNETSTQYEKSVEDLKSIKEVSSQSASLVVYDDVEFIFKIISSLNSDTELVLSFG